MFRVTVAIAAMLASAGAAAQDLSQPSFCERMAAELKLESTTSKKYYDGRPTWRINKLGGIGTALFGGSTFLRLGVGTDVAYGPEDHRRVANACSMVKNGYRCMVQSPDYVQVGVDDQMARFDTEPGEKAEVEILKGSVICRDGWPAGWGDDAEPEQVGQEA